MAGSSLRDRLNEGVALRWQGRFAEARYIFDETVRNAEAVGDDSVAADAIHWAAIVRSLVASGTDELEEVLAMQERATSLDIATYGEIHNRVAEGLRVVGGTLHSLGRFDAAIVALSRAAEICRILGEYTAGFEDILFKLKESLLGQDPSANVIDVARERVVVCEGLGDSMRLCYAHLELGRLLVERGNNDEALIHLERARKIAEPRISQGRAWRLAEDLEHWFSRARGEE